MGVLPTCISVYHMYAGALKRPERGIRTPRNRVTDDCKPPCGFWESTPGPLKISIFLKMSPLDNPNISNFLRIVPSFFLIKNTKCSAAYFVENEYTH